jgi:hypothetical protein
LFINCRRLRAGSCIQKEFHARRRNLLSLPLLAVLSTWAQAPAGGTADPGTFGVSRDLKARLKSKGIEHKLIETPGARTWMVRRRNLTDLAPLLFQAKN